MPVYVIQYCTYMRPFASAVEPCIMYDVKVPYVTSTSVLGTSGVRGEYMLKVYLRARFRVAESRAGYWRELA